MSATTAIQVFGIIHFGVVGISHIVAHRAWAEFFVLLREKGHAGVFTVAFMSLWFGSIIVAFHPVWSGIPAVLTVLGWMQVVKGTMYFVAPGFGLRRLQMVSVERSKMFVIPGFVLVAVAGLLAFHLVSVA